MTFDWSLNLSAVFNAVFLLIGLVGTFHRIGSRVDLLALRIKTLEEAVRENRDIDTRLTTIEERVTNHVAMIVRDQKENSEFRIASSKELSEAHSEIASIRSAIEGIRADLSGLRRGEGWIAGPRKTVDGEY